MTMASMQSFQNEMSEIETKYFWPNFAPVLVGLIEFIYLAAIYFAILNHAIPHIPPTLRKCQLHRAHKHNSRLCCN